jgi:hypothetical protein
LVVVVVVVRMLLVESQVSGADAVVVESVPSSQPLEKLIRVAVVAVVLVKVCLLRTKVPMVVQASS